MNKMVLLLACSLFANDWSKHLLDAGITKENQTTLSKVSGIGGRLCQSLQGKGKVCIPKETYDLLSMTEKALLHSCLQDRKYDTTMLSIVPMDTALKNNCEILPLDIQSLSPTDFFINAGSFVCSIKAGQDSLFVSVCRSAED